MQPTIQTLALSLSTPQPRLNELFHVAVDLHLVREQLFGGIASAALAVETWEAGEDGRKMTLPLRAMVKGAQTAGPLAFTLNGTAYTSNVVHYEVIDALPDVDEGLWTRMVQLPDGEGCVIIEQRIPTTCRQPEEGSGGMLYEPTTEQVDWVQLKRGYVIKGLKRGKGYSTRGVDWVKGERGERRYFLYAYTIQYFSVEAGDGGGFSWTEISLSDIMK